MNKKTLILLLIGMVLCLNLKAQNDAVNYLNAQLRAYFSPLTKPNPSKPFLYDMAAHVTDSVFFSTTCIDTLETEMWYKVYDEMFHSAYDTTLFQPLDAVWTNGNKFNPDTVPMGIMNFAFYKLKKDAMTTGNYFNFDTINDILSDKFPRKSEPYIDSLMFAAAPMVPTAHFLNPVFRVDPHLIYFDAFTSAMFYPSKFQLRIDFGDGLGEIIFDPTIVTNYQVNYHDNGEHIINTAIYDERGVLLEKSTSNVTIIAPTANVPADQYFDFDGIRAGLFSGCNATGLSGKTVIYIEGFDMLDFIPAKNRTVNDIYSTMISNDKIVQLKNEGYSFLVLDWKNSRIDMRFNALYLLNLIEYLKSNISDEEQFVIIGESMGGVIGRYVLTYMETKDYTNQNTQPFFVEENDPNNKLYMESYGHQLHNLPSQWGDLGRRHNTRLLITFDSPHQGANISMSIQHVYHTAMGVFGKYISENITQLTTAFNLFLDGQGAQQLLIYHIDTKSGSGNCTYSARPEKNSFFSQLQSWSGGYPHYAKVVSLSSGSLLGEKQTNYNLNTDRVAGDKLIEFEASLYARVLWHRINIFNGQLDAYTNPDGDGKIFDVNATWFKIRLKLKRFGIKLSWNGYSLLNQTQNAHLKPLCVNSGGYMGNPLFITNSPSNNSYNLSNTYWLLNWFHYKHTVTGKGCVLFDSHLGLNGFASINFDYSLCSDGINFCFVPIASALDYGTVLTNPFPFDIASDIQSTNFAYMTGPSVIIGHPDHGTKQNYNHLEFRNPLIYNLSGGPSPLTFSDYIYYSCVNATEPVERGLLNLEIGDEELYLENVNLHWDAEYQTEWAIHTNENNPYYQYPSGCGTLCMPGCYSLSGPYVIDLGAFATFSTDYDVNVLNSGFFLTGVSSSDYYKNDQPVTVCCINFIGKNSMIPPITTGNISKESYISIFPNPNGNVIAEIKYKFNTLGSYVKADIINAFGSIVNSKEISSTNNTDETSYSINFGPMQLKPGIYLIRLTNGNQVLSTKLIIN